ncbi:MAG: hypothetical protein SGBAC_011925, partial [Bacillariaceae sp.]
MRFSQWIGTTATLLLMLFQVSQAVIPCTVTTQRRAFTNVLELRLAVSSYLNTNGADPAVRSIYGFPIGCWDTSQMVTMSPLFMGWTTFNEDISEWDVSSVTNMDNMFFGCSQFNQPIGKWNTRSLFTASRTFGNA